MFHHYFCDAPHNPEPVMELSFFTKVDPLLANKNQEPKNEFWLDYDCCPTPLWIA